MNTVRDVATFLGYNASPILVTAIAQSLDLTMPISLRNLLEMAEARMSVDSVTQLIASGPPGIKKNFVVLGDGFAAGEDQAIYNNAVRDLLINGVFKHDYFLEDVNAFNVYRVNLISQDSGVGTKDYTQNPPAVVTRNTALGIYYTDAAHCFFEGGPNTDQLIERALTRFVPDHDYVLKILNHPGFGGCGSFGQANISLGITWDVLAHELGHALGGLADEYGRSGWTWTNGEPPGPNSTINTDRSTLKWASFIDKDKPPDSTEFTDIPSGIGPNATYNQGTKPSWWNPNTSVGLFEGGEGCELGAYRPVLSCRMNQNNPPFCPVCHAHLKLVNRDFLEILGESMEELTQGYVRLTIHVENGKLSVTGIHEVAGPLVIRTTMSRFPGFVYEILVGEKSVAVGALGLVGVRRSFTNRSELGHERERFFTAENSFDFFARVPKKQLSRAVLPRLKIVLYKVRKAPDHFMTSVPLLRHEGIDAAEVGQLSGISLQKLPLVTRNKLERILKRNAKL